LRALVRESGGRRRDTREGERTWQGPGKTVSWAQDPVILHAADDAGNREES